MNSKCNFIVTQDKETAEKLSQCGIKLLSDCNGVYTFENKMSIMNFNYVKPQEEITNLTYLCKQFFLHQFH